MFEYEMLLPPMSVAAFRQLGMLVCVDELIKNKTRSLRCALVNACDLD